ncbi:MAG: hypothetical protein KAJ24_03175 [Candidatus Aenigmarchaeota archaeon]|nr:hypothetical protein [Candidatus Aenigmarchaeota archaeon]
MEREDTEIDDMKIVGETVEFRSGEGFFEKELSGRKPNTERILSGPDRYDIMSCSEIKIIFTSNPKNSFTRKITDISVVGELLGKYFVVISWKHEGV